MNTQPPAPMNAAHALWSVTIGEPSRGAMAYWVSPSSPEEAQAHKAIIEQAPTLLAQRDELREALKDLCAWFHPNLDPSALFAGEHLLGGCPNDIAASITKARNALANAQKP